MGRPFSRAVIDRSGTSGSGVGLKGSGALENDVASTFGDQSRTDFRVFTKTTLSDQLRVAVGIVDVSGGGFALPKRIALVRRRAAGKGVDRFFAVGTDAFGFPTFGAPSRSVEIAVEGTRAFVPRDHTPRDQERGAVAVGRREGRGEEDAAEPAERRPTIGVGRRHQLIGAAI